MREIKDMMAVNRITSQIEKDLYDALGILAQERYAIAKEKGNASSSLSVYDRNGGCVTSVVINDVMNVARYYHAIYGVGCYVDTYGKDKWPCICVSVIVTD